MKQREQHERFSAFKTLATNLVTEHGVTDTHLLQFFECDGRDECGGCTNVPAECASGRRYLADYIRFDPYLMLQYQVRRQRQIILHEIAHALYYNETGEHGGHGKGWQGMALRIGMSPSAIRRDLRNARWWASRRATAGATR
jgi:hypothetical protein